MSDVAFSPWYINTRRLSDVTKVTLSARAQSSIAHNDMHRVEAMHQARAVAQALVLSGKVPNLGTLIANGSFPGNVMAGVWANCIFRGAAAAFRASEKNRPVPKPGVSVQVIIGDRVCWLDGTLEIEHFYSSSAVSTLSGQKQMFILGQMEIAPKADRGAVHPWLIGDLLEVVDVLPLSWGRASDVYPGSIDAFAKMHETIVPTESGLRSIMREVSEENVKTAIAEILGEPFVPKDWGGERSDLYTNRVTIDGLPTTAAFLFKGPAVPGPMHIANLGKRGDQIVRLFDEPAELLVLQHGNKVETPVRKMMRTFAVDPMHPRRYCIIDGADTYRILRAYGFLSKDGKFKPKAAGRRKKRRVPAPKRRAR